MNPRATAGSASPDALGTAAIRRSERGRGRRVRACARTEPGSLDPEMTGDDADPVLIGVVLDGIYRQIQARYHTAQLDNDPDATRAYLDADDVVAAIRSATAARPGITMPHDRSARRVARIDTAGVPRFCSGCGGAGCEATTNRLCGVATLWADGVTARWSMPSARCGIGGTSGPAALTFVPRSQATATSNPDRRGSSSRSLRIEEMGISQSIRLASSTTRVAVPTPRRRRYRSAILPQHA